MTPTLISVTNESAKLSDAEVAAAVQAIGRQLAQHVAPIWGMVPAIEFRHVDSPLPADACPCVISDTPDIPDALGYHDEDENGVPYIKVFVIGADDWRVTLSHEVLELALDAAANLWADGPDGHDYAREACDADQGGTYTIDGIPVSNFVYPAFFDPKARSNEKLDYLGRLTHPFDTGISGYQIVRTEPGSVGQIFGRHASRIQVADGLHLIFGPEFPESQRTHKCRRALARRGGRFLRDVGRMTDEEIRRMFASSAPPPSYVAIGSADTWDGREETSR